jgi:hypothetical protein
VSDANPSLKQRAEREIKEFLVIFMYLWVIFALFAVYKSVILAQHHIDISSHGFAILNAFALGKVMLVARKLRFGDFSPNAPLIYPTILKSGIFSVILGCFKILEEVAVGFYQHKSFQESIAELGGGTLKGILSLTAILFVVLTPFFAFAELQRVVGKGKLRQIFFHRHDALTVSERSSGAAFAS